MPCDEDHQKAPAARARGGSVGVKSSSNTSITVDTTSTHHPRGKPETGGRKRKDRGADSGGAVVDGRTSSPTSVSDFPLAARGGNIFRATPPENAAGDDRESTGGEDDVRGMPQTPSRAAFGPSGDVGGSAKLDGVAAASPCSEDDARASAEFMSAQALFRGSIPGLTSFGELIMRVSLFYLSVHYTVEIPGEVLRLRHSRICFLLLLCRCGG